MEDSPKMEWKPNIDTSSGVLTLMVGTWIPEGTEEEFKKNMHNMFDIEIKHIVGVVTTLPDEEHQGMDEPPTGGRTDLFFVVEGEDIPKFAPARFGATMQIRWWEDIFFNDGEGIYPKEFIEAYPNPVEHMTGWNEQKTLVKETLDD